MMICTIILFSYLITCCTHLVSLAKITTTTPAPIIIHQHYHIHDHKHQPAFSQAEAALTGSGTLATNRANNKSSNLSRGDYQDDDGQGQRIAIKVHKLMSELDLRRTFQVDSHDQVPEYEVLTISNKLEPELLPLTARALEKSTKFNDHQQEREKAESNEKQNDQEEGQSGNNHQSSDQHHPLVKLKLSTFGKQFKLRLKRNVDFQQRIKDMKMFMAESTEDGKLRYTEVSPSSPKLAKRKRQDEDSRKLLEDVQGQLAASIQQPNHTTYHDEENLAALLIDHDKETGRLQLDGTIGNDFVIKPLPESSIRALAAAHATKKEVVLPPSPEVSHHVVFRQKPSSEESSSEHKHSFMVSPGERLQASGSMEQVALSFSKEVKKPSRKSGEESKIEENLIEDSSAGEFGDLDREESETEPETDLAQDPFGGQFHLEPGLIKLEQMDNWSLMKNYTNSSSNQHKRFKRHIRASRLNPINQASGPRPAGSQVRRKRQAPDTVWPEVLLVVDYDSFLLHGGDSRDVKRYFVSFWNGVDLRYKLLVHPHIRISLAGMIVAKDRDATPYLERNRLRAPNADAVDAAGALTDMGKYLYREDRLPTYDLAVVITKLDMCRRRYEGGRCNRGTAGFAYVGGACVVNKRLEKVNSVAIIEDSGGFSGIIVAAHEVGHLLGCVHDGSPPPSYLGGPGATHCPWEDGFIMSDLRHTERGFRWSQCSVEQFKHFLNGETATCLYNYPHESQMLHRLSPGTMLSLDEQCKRDRGTNACFKDARVCAQLFCFDSASGYCVSYRPAAEGSPCGEGQVCRNGKCVGEIENIIPDYTHQSQTVVAPAGPTSGRQQRQPAAAAAAAGSRLGVAESGGQLSASSSSLAASTSAVSPSIDKVGSMKLTSAAAAETAAAISSRMDTLPIDLPMDNSPPLSHQTPNSTPPAVRFSPRSGSHTTISTRHHSTSGEKPSMMVRQTTSTTSSNYQQRSGHQALPKATGANNNNRQPNNNNPNLYSNNLNNNNDHYQALLASQNNAKQRYYINNKVY